MCFTKLKDGIDNLNQALTEFYFDTDYTDNCDYLEQESLKEVPINHEDLTVIQINIRGLISKQNKLLDFLNGCNKSKIDVVILAETWLTKSSQEIASVPGYELVGEICTNKKGGGVGILINNKLKYKT